VAGVWLVLARPVIRDGPQTRLVTEIPDLVADGSSRLVPSPGRAIVGRPGPCEHFKRALHVRAAHADPFADLVRLAGPMLSKPVEDPLGELRPAVGK
jgi:hypothetical protein